MTEQPCWRPEHRFLWVSSVTGRLTCDACESLEPEPLPDPNVTVEMLARWGRIEGVTLQREEIEGAPV